MQAGPEQRGGAGLRAEPGGSAKPWDGVAWLSVPGRAAGASHMSPQSGGGEPGTLPALGTSGDVWTWHQIFSTSARFCYGSAGPTGPLTCRWWMMEGHC